MKKIPSSPYVIAEIGCNHMGDFDIAREMIEVARTFSRVNAVKLQKREPRLLLSEEEFNRPHPVPENSFGDTYGLHREALEFDGEQHRRLQLHAREHHVDYSASVWELTSARTIAALNPPWIKIPSACNLDFEMLQFLTREYRGSLHISLGMTTRQEEADIVQFLRAEGALGRSVLYACTSGYPVPVEDLALLEIPRLVEAYGNEAEGIGFSGHHTGISMDVAAVTLGARYIERHFTLNRTWKGTDHAASLEPDGMRRLARDVRNTLLALSAKDPEVLPIEEVQRAKLKRPRKQPPI